MCGPINNILVMQVPCLHSYVNGIQNYHDFSPRKGFIYNELCNDVICNKEFLFINIIYMCVCDRILENLPSTVHKRQIK